MKKRTAERLKVWMVCGGVLAGFLLIAHMFVFHLNWAIALNAWSRNEDFVFVGKVVDITGQPVSDARVDAVITYANTKAMLDGRTARRYDVTVQTDSQGMFRVKGDGTHIAILDVKKSGYRWIWELDGFETHEPSARNTSYSLSSWKPDPANLPIYPLQPVGETATTRPSRGGFDLRGGGGWKKNEPTEPRRSSIDHPEEVEKRRQFRNRQEE